MGSVLIEQSPLFRSILEDCDRYLAEVPEKPSWSIIEELQRPKGQSNIYKAEFSQPLCTALQLSLTALLASWDFRPTAVVGHSSGEIAAACAAGLMSLRDAIVTAFYRGLVLSSTNNFSLPEHCEGRMCAVSLNEEQTRNLLADYGDQVQLAAINSPTSCTISGNSGAIQEIEASCAKNGQFCRRLHADKGTFSFSKSY